MASKLSAAMGQWQSQGSERLRGRTGMSVQQTQVSPDGSYAQKSQLIGTLGKMAEIGADAYMKYDQKKQQRADERSNEIIAKLTPEQRREALSNGTLLYQDDPYAMKALKEKTGRNAAFLVDDEVSQKIQNGEFRTRGEMEEFRHSRLQEHSKSFADEFGIDPTDKDYQRGFNSDITQRNIQLYGAHDSYISEQNKKGALLNSRVELNSVLSDPASLRSPHAGEFFESYFKNGLVTGSIPSDDQAQAMIGQSLADVTGREGGTQFLDQVGDRKITLHGKETTYRDLLGADQWNALKVKAQRTEFDYNQKRTAAFDLSINSAVNQADLSKGWEQLNAIEQELSRIQPGDEMTPQKQQLINARQSIQNQFAQSAQKDAIAMDKAQKSVNKQKVIESQYDKRINGDWVSTDAKDMPTNEATGEFTHSDMVNFANSKLSQIDQMDVPQEQKDALKLKYLRADSNNGGFRTAVGVMVTDASQEYASAVMNGKMPQSTPALDKLREIRNADPEMFSMLYPEQADLFMTMDMMDRDGVDAQVLLDADRAQTMKTKDMQFEDDKAWAALHNDSTAKELAAIPASLDTQARKIYESYKYRTGNSSAALQQTIKYLKDNTTTFTNSDADGSTVGVITKNTLRVTDDPRSWEQGRSIIEEAVKGIVKSNPYVTNQQLSIYQRGDSIYLMSTEGDVHIRYDNATLRKVFADQQQKAQQKATDEAIQKANQRAPISAAGAAREAAAERVRAKRKDIPKFIYGRDE